MDGIVQMTRHIVSRAKLFEHDTIPGDFGVLSIPCPKCGGEVRERYRAFQCIKCDFSVRKIISGRLLDNSEAEQIIRDRQIGPLQGFRSRMGKPFAAVLKLNAENKLEFDFGPDQKGQNGAGAEVDFTGQEPVGQCPRCGNRVFETAMAFVCEKAVGANRTCDFRLGKIILQQPIERPQAQKILAERKSDLLDKFISKRGRPFKAFLVLKGGDVSFEFEPRPAKAKRAGGKAQGPREPAPKIDFTGLQPLAGKCPRCEGQVFETDTAYLCEKSQADRRPCKFKMSKQILQQPIDRAQAEKLLATNRSDLLNQFISKAGRPFPAWLVMDEMGKITFEFPPRDSEPEKS
jgi:Zn finger protein HypA/HybF involved in hydrogenase expression